MNMTPSNWNVQNRNQSIGCNHVWESYKWKFPKVGFASSHITFLDRESISISTKAPKRDSFDAVLPVRIDQTDRRKSVHNEKCSSGLWESGHRLPWSWTTLAQLDINRMFQGVQFERRVQSFITF
jgi:hypothetical protein